MARQTRRYVLKALAGSGVAVGLAGCTGDNGDPDPDPDSDPDPDPDDDPDADPDADPDDDPDEEPTEEYSWPPPRNIVELSNDSQPGGLIDMLARLWQPYFEDALDDDVSLAIGNEPEAGGVIMSNRIANDSEGHGGSMGSMRAISLISNQIGRDDANYDVRDLRPVVRFSADTRGLQMNPQTTPVEDHFDITWAEFQDFVADSDDPLIQPLANPAHTVLGLYLYGNDPVIDLDNDINMVVVGGGSEARAAMERGDADLYFGSYVSNITTRNDFYYTQFAMVNPDADPDFYDSIKDVTPEFSPVYGDNPTEKVLDNYQDQAIITNIDEYPDEEGEKVVEMVADHHIAFLPPNTPDDIYQIHADAWQEAAESDELAEEVMETFAEPDHNPLAGEAVEEAVMDTFETYQDDEIRTLVEEELF